MILYKATIPIAPVSKKNSQRILYNRKRGDITLLIPAIERQKKSEQWRREGGRYIPNPSTWLNQCLWEDDLETKTETLRDGPGMDRLVAEFMRDGESR